MTDTNVILKTESNLNYDQSETKLDNEFYANDSKHKLNLSNSFIKGI